MISRSAFFLLLLLVSLALTGCRNHLPNTHANSKRMQSYIIVYGDTREGHEVHKKIVNKFLDYDFKAVFNTGDLVTDGWDKEQWNVFNEITGEIRAKAPYYPVAGNHEYNSDLYYDNFELPNNEKWYSVDIGNIHFIALDTNWHIFKYSDQYDWLEEDLKNVDPGIKFKVVILHHPPFSSGTHPEDEKRLRESIVPLFEKYRVDLVFCGHEHSYERLYHNGIIYIITGGGGAPLYGQGRVTDKSAVFKSIHHFCLLHVQNNRLAVKVFDPDSNLIDQVSITANKPVKK
jgi:predicted phosphodiesterase